MVWRSLASESHETGHVASNIPNRFDNHYESLTRRPSMPLPWSLAVMPRYFAASSCLQQPPLILFPRYFNISIRVYFHVLRLVLKRILVSLPGLRSRRAIHLRRTISLYIDPEPARPEFGNYSFLITSELRKWRNDCCLRCRPGAKQPHASLFAKSRRRALSMRILYQGTISRQLLWLVKDRNRRGCQVLDVLNS